MPSASNFASLTRAPGRRWSASSCPNTPTRYGMDTCQMHGPYEPDAGHRFNPNKLLLDPYAKQVIGRLTRNPALFGYVMESGDDLTFDERDSAAFMVKASVVDTAFSWGQDRRPATAWEKTVIYETHVKGFTKRHPRIPERLRGTYAGLASADAMDYVRSLGVTALEL